MLLLVTGGAASGKSEYAEQAALALGSRPVYLATLRAEGEEGRRRVERHRVLRAGKGFSTLEHPVNLAAAPLPARSTVLLECLTTLTANELFEPDGAGSPDNAFETLRLGFEALRMKTSHLIVVTNLLDRDGLVFTGGTACYLALLERLEAWLAGRADAVIEVVCGIPLAVKGVLV